MYCMLPLISVWPISASLVLSQKPPELAIAPHSNSSSPVGSKSGANDQPPPQFAMSQLHGVFATTQLPPASATTWANGLGSRSSLIPTAVALDLSWVISASIHAVPDAYGRVKLSPCPFLIPGPHRPGSAQLDTPSGTTVQPWLASSDLALAGSYGNRSPALPCGDRNGVTGASATGPFVVTP